ncbi:hypothetical protein GKQ38_03690 [Candidatus Nanohaloarchaea archaeon]|nr:hypothetical protein GKQ38_03690 [Candidatus Nanohaloarchaea archaeon]
MDKKYHLAATFLLVFAIVTVQAVGQTASVKTETPNTTSNETNTSEKAYDLTGYQGIRLYEENRTIYLDSIGLKQKIGLMTETWRLNSGRISQDDVMGGFHLGGLGSRESTMEVIHNYSQGRPIEPLVSMDMEGCGNPISGFMKSKSLDEIKNVSSARRLGEKHGSHLRKIGVDINYAPVLDVNDTIWKCRSFEGDYRETAEKGCAYIRGLQSEGVMATAKHFPGETLTGKDPHNKIKHVNLTKEDTYPFRKAVECNVSAIMISHQITTGVIDSNGKPASVSRNVVRTLREEYGFKGLIVTDAINMGGIDKYYESEKKKYLALFRAGNDFILNLAGNEQDKKEMVKFVAQAVRSGKLDKSKIDRSVTRLLNARGWTVVTEDDNRTRVYRPGRLPGPTNINSLKE